MRKTKIVCTLGPATDSREILKEMMLSGMNVARINFSHSNHEEHSRRIAMVKELRDELGLPIGLLADTKGPEIRLGQMEPDTVLLEGQNFTLTPMELTGNRERASISFAGLAGDVTLGTRILIDDGLIELKVKSIMGDDINCRVIHGGPVLSRKGLNVPGVQFSMPYISSSDRSDLRFAVKNGFDFVAASFTRSADDVQRIREELSRLRGEKIRIIAKIENADGVTNIDSILRVADGIMVARGDLGVEVPLEEIPVIQKKLIKKAYNAGRQVITATQMLESMVNNPRPTRAESTDVANAIYDGTSAIMLSGETAAGKFPVEAVRTMATIARRTEHDIDYKKRFRNRDVDDIINVTNAISHATCTTAHDLDAKAVITVTKSGVTARMISKYRPACPIIGCTTDPVIQRQMNMSWGVTPLILGEQSNTDELFAAAVKATVDNKLIKDGDLVVITTGVPLGISGTTNLLKVHVVGEVIDKM